MALPPDEGSALLGSSSGEGGSQKFCSVGNSRPRQEEAAFSVAEDDMNRVYCDRPEHMTLARRIALRLSRHPWYRPRGSATAATKNAAAARAVRGSGGSDTGGSSLPRLEGAWSYFEHFVLPRYFVPREGEGEAGRDHDRQKAEPGESSAETRLYEFWSTPEKDLADMGVGIGIYFFTLRCLGIVLLLAGCINIPNLIFYFNNHDEEGVLPYVLRSSAICTDHHWAACPSCTRGDWDYYPRTFDRYAATADGRRTFIKTNLCRFGYWLGFWNWLSIVFVAVALYGIFFHAVARRAVAYDEGEQTAADYSVAVENPPGDARDAGKWREFFARFGHVTCLTLAVNNDGLVGALLERRHLMYRLQQLLPPGVRFDKFDLDAMAARAMPLKWFEIATCAAHGAQLRSQIAELDEKIAGFSTAAPAVATVFVTFETEAAQRAALQKLCVRRWDTLTNNASALPKALLYDEKHLLRVVEPPEPSAVRWQDLGDSCQKRLALRFVTSSITGVLIVCGVALIVYCRNAYGPGMAAVAISALNTAAPMICYELTGYESHRSEGGKQASRYGKVLLSMLIFTAIVTSAITPFTDTVSNSSDSILYSLYAIFICELVRAPVTQCGDIFGNVQRHLLGPRVTNHLKLAELFAGTPYELSERYTNMTNVLFLTFYYATIFPAGFFFAALTMSVYYYTDKYCLLRVWAPNPRIGLRVSDFCRIFIVLSLVVLALVSSYYVSGFPFDNACEGDRVPPEYVGEFEAVDGDGNPVSVSIDADENAFYYCDMDMQRYRPPAFPAWALNQPKGYEWMDKDQANITWLFGWTSIVMVILVGLVFVHRVALPSIQHMFFGLYTPAGNPNDIGFSSVKEIFAYVPQVRVPNQQLPTLICNVNNIDRGLIGWNDPVDGVNAHNVFYDLPGLAEKKIFSEIYHWPPKGK